MPATAPSSTATGWKRPTTLKARFSAFVVFRRSSPSTVRKVASDLPDGGTPHLRRGGLGARGPHHPPFATTLPIPKLNFRELRQCLVRRKIVMHIQISICV